MLWTFCVGAVLLQIVTETVPALQKLKDAGKVRHIGISGLPLNAFRYVLDRVPKGSVEVVLSYCHYSLNDTSLLEIVPYLQEKGIGIINASPLSMGLLSGQTPPEWHPAPSELKVLVSHLVLLQLLSPVYTYLPWVCHLPVPLATLVRCRLCCAQACFQWCPVSLNNKWSAYWGWCPCYLKCEWASQNMKPLDT